MNERVTLNRIDKLCVGKGKQRNKNENRRSLIFFLAKSYLYIYIYDLMFFLKGKDAFLFAFAGHSLFLSFFFLLYLFNWISNVKSHHDLFFYLVATCNNKKVIWIFFCNFVEELAFFCCCKTHHTQELHALWNKTKSKKKKYIFFCKRNESR